MTKCFEKGPKRVYKFGIICKDYKVIPHMYAHIMAKAAFFFPVKDPECWLGQVLNPVASCLADQCSSTLTCSELQQIISMTNVKT